MRNAIPGIEPRGAHRAGSGVLLAVHELIDNERSIWRGEQFAQSHFSGWRIALVKKRGPLYELIVLQERARRQLSAKRGDLFAQIHQVDLSETQFFTFGKILR